MVRLPALVIVVISLGCSAITGGDPDELGAATLDTGTGTLDAGLPPRDGGPIPGIDAGPPPIEVDAAPIDPDAGPPDAGPPPDPSRGRVECGDATCQAFAGELCCVRRMERRLSTECLDPADGATCECEGLFCETYEITCDGREDCPGSQLCCALKGVTDEVATRHVCQAACMDTIITQQLEVCRVREDGTNTCRDPGARCAADRRVLDPYRVCT